MPTGTDVTFSVDTGADAKQVKLVFKGKEQKILDLEKADGAGE